MSEIWKNVPIEGYENYKVSNKGNIKNSKNILLKPRLKPSGNLEVTFSVNKKYRTIIISNLVAMTFIPNSNEKKHVKHIDGNKENNNLENLEWCNYHENVNEEDIFIKKTDKTIENIEDKDKIIIEDIYTIEWKSVNIENVEHYIVSNKGDVINTKLNKNKKLNFYKNSKGYQISLSNRSVIKQSIKKMVHRLVAELFIENNDNLPYIYHKNGDKYDNRIENLAWCSISPKTIKKREKGIINNYVTFEDNITINSSNDKNNKEIWKNVNIEQFTHYKVSNLGNIKNARGLNKLKLTKNQYGYFSIDLSNTNNNTIKQLAHRIVAYTFISIPEKYSNINIENLVINHKDLNKTNNRVENLEWCTQQENIQHANDNKKMNKTDIIITNNGETREYESFKSAGKILGINPGTIVTRCNNKNNKEYRYKNEKPKKEFYNHIKEDDKNIKKVYGFDKYLIDKNTTNIYSLYKINIQLIKQISAGGYLIIRLSKEYTDDEGKKYIKARTVQVHRAMLMTFNPYENMENLLVNHKDLNKENNNLENLEWCTPQENTQHFIDNTQGYQKEIDHYDIDGNKLNEYKSIVFACKQIYNKHDKKICKIISKICNGNRFSYDGYRYTFKGEKLKEYVRENNSEKPIIQYNLEGNILKEYKCSKDLCKELYSKIQKKDENVTEKTFKNRCIQKIYKICKHNSNVNNPQDYLLFDNTVYKYKEQPIKYIGKYDMNNNFLKLYNNVEEAIVDTFGTENRGSKKYYNYIVRVCTDVTKSTCGNIYKYIYDNSEEYNEIISKEDV